MTFAMRPGAVWCISSRGQRLLYHRSYDPLELPGPLGVLRWRWLRGRRLDRERRAEPFLTALCRGIVADKRGVVVVMAGLMAPIAIGMVGLGIDVSLWHLDRMTLLGAATQGAYSGAVDLAAGRSPDVAKASATATALSNVCQPHDCPTNATVEVSTDGSSVTVSINRVEPQFLSSLFVAAPTASARAVASYQAGQRPQLTE